MENIEIDVVALDCSWVEYPSIEEAIDQEYHAGFLELRDKATHHLCEDFFEDALEDYIEYCKGELERNSTILTSSNMDVVVLST